MEGHGSLEVAGPELEGATFEEEPFTLHQFRFEIGGGLDFDADFWGDEEEGVGGFGSTAFLGGPGDVGGLDAFAGLDGALGEGAAVPEEFTEEAADLELVFAVAAARGGAQDNPTPAIGLDAVGQRRKVWVLAYFSPGHGGGG